MHVMHMSMVMTCRWKRRMDGTTMGGVEEEEDGRQGEGRETQTHVADLDSQ